MPVIVQCMTTRDDQNKVCGVLPFVSDLVNLANSFESKLCKFYYFTFVLMITRCSCTGTHTLSADVLAVSGEGSV